MPTFIVKNNPGLKNPIILDEEDLHHLVHAMRAKAGEVFSVTDNQGQMAEVKIKKTKPFECELLQVKTLEKPFPITLCLCLFQMNRLEWAVQKLCELNIKAIQFIVSERCQLRELVASKMERLTKITLEVQKQCGRAYPLELLPCVPLKEFTFNKNDTYIVGAITPTATKKITTPDKKSVLVFVGPEGDFTQEEYDFLQKHGTQFIDLGNIILKSETAALVLTTLVKHSLENSHV